MVSIWIGAMLRWNDATMRSVPVSSSSVRSVGYDDATNTLEIEFQSGAAYQYLRVPPAAYRLLLQAPSIGEYVNKVIKPRFSARRV